MLLAPERNRREEQQDYEEHPGHHTRKTHVISLESCVVNKNRHKCCSSARAAVGNNERAVEFLERLNKLCNQVVENNRRNEWNGDGEELSLF